MLQVGSKLRSQPLIWLPLPPYSLRFTILAVPADRLFFGEVSLSGAIRASAHAALRLKEAKKLGFKHAVISESGDIGQDGAKMSLSRLSKLNMLADELPPCQ